MKPGAQVQLPVTLWQSAPFWQAQGRRQPSPWKPAGQESLQWGPDQPGRHTQAPVTGWQLRGEDGRAAGEGGARQRVTGAAT